MTDTTGQSDIDHYYAHNHLYSPVALIADDGDVEERYEYNAYGKAAIYNDGFTQTYTASQHDNPYYFTGRRLDQLDEDVSGDPQFEIMYYRNRYYDPTNGRFLNHDPLGINVYQFLLYYYPSVQYIDGLNLYNYLKSNPINGTDEFGLVSPGCSKVLTSTMGLIVRNNFRATGRVENAPFAHCHTACRLTQECGENFARRLGQFKEVYDEIFEDGASYDDLEANEDGIGIGKDSCNDEEDCEEKCASKYGNPGNQKLP